MGQVVGSGLSGCRQTAVSLRAAGKMALEKLTLKDNRGQSQASGTGPGPRPQKPGGWPPGCWAPNQGSQGGVKRAGPQTCLDRPGGGGVPMYLSPADGTWARTRAEDFPRGQALSVPRVLEWAPLGLLSRKQGEDEGCGVTQHGARTHLGPLTGYANQTSFSQSL